MRREAHEAASESCEKTGWGAPECPEKLSQVKSRHKIVGGIVISAHIDVCNGKRYNNETLTVKYKGKNISEVLNMTVEQATIFFEAVPKIKKKLDTLNQVGLGYLKLGQPATTLSGGEAQRVKLAKELSKTSTGKTIYLLDEPTTGLHFHDVQLLMDVLQKLNSQGNTIVVIEHNLDVIRNSDWIIDIGPEGGNGGGEIVAAGNTSQLAKCKKSYTGKFL